MYFPCKVLYGLFSGSGASPEETSTPNPCFQGLGVQASPQDHAYTEGTPILLQKTQIKSDMAHSTSGHHDITIVVFCCALHKRLSPFSSQEPTAYEGATPKKSQTVVS